MPERLDSHLTLGQRLKWAALSPIAGYSMGNYVQVDWPKIDPNHIISSSELEPPTPVFIDGEPRAIPGWPRTWKMLGLIAVWDTDLKKAQEQYPELPHAVAYSDPKSGITRAASLPSPIQFGYDPYLPELRIIGMRVGRGPLVARMGLWARGHDFVQIPWGQSRGKYSRDRFPYLFPGTPAV